MTMNFRKTKAIFLTLTFTIFLIFISFQTVFADTLSEIKKRGVLRHLGVPYANFVTGSGDGMDVELIQKFAQYLEVDYQYIPASWKESFSALTGKKVQVKGDNVEVLGKTPVKGDVQASGITILPWREKILLFSDVVFPTQVWLIARADSPVAPIKPTGNLDNDIAAVKSLLAGKTILGIPNTCLSPDLYGLEKYGVHSKVFKGGVNELAPAILNGDAELTLLDVPDVMVALEKWPGQIKVIGPISHKQLMAVAFDRSSPDLRDAFNDFLSQSKANGTYLELVEKYYPSIKLYFPDFFTYKQ